MVGSVQDAWTWTPCSAVCQGHQQPHSSQNRISERQRQSLARITMALNNMAQQVVKGLHSLTLPCAGTWHLVQRLSVIMYRVNCRSFGLSGQGFLVTNVCWHQTALLQQISYMWHTFMKVLAHEDEINILKQKKSITTFIFHERTA